MRNSSTRSRVHSQRASRSLRCWLEDRATAILEAGHYPPAIDGTGCVELAMRNFGGPARVDEKVEILRRAGGEDCAVQSRHVAAIRAPRAAAAEVERADDRAGVVEIADRPHSFQLVTGAIPEEALIGVLILDGRAGGDPDRVHRRERSARDARQLSTLKERSVGRRVEPDDQRARVDCE